MVFEMNTLRVATYNIHKGVQGLGPARRLGMMFKTRLPAATETLEQLRTRPWHERWRDGIAFAVMRTVLFLTGHRY